MAITNYLVHFKTEATYNNKKSELRNDAVAFVKDATIIHTHGTDYYCGSGPVALKSDLSGYATTSALTSGLAGKANTSHTHTIAQVSGLQAELDSKLESADLSGYALKTDIPSLSGGASATSGQYVSGVTVSGHEITVTKAALPVTTLSSLGITATAAELNYCDGVTSNIQTQLNGKAPTSHTHTFSNITDSLPGNRITGTVANATNATVANGVKDYNGTQNILIGFSGAGLDENSAKFLAAYDAGGAHIKDITPEKARVLIGAAPLSHKQAYIDSELSDYTANENTMGCSPAAVKKAIGLFAISKDMSAEATTLEAGNQATVSYNKDTNKLTIGVPKGPAGPAGVSENFTITFANGTSEGVTKYTYNGGASKTLNINGTDGIAISGTTGNVNISGANFLPKSYFGSWKIQVDEEHSMIYIGDSSLELSRHNSVTIRKDPSTKIPKAMGVSGEIFATMPWVNSQLTLSKIQELWGSNTLDVPSGTLNAKKVNAKEGFFETSDARLKDFTNNITSLEIISSIPTKYFTWKSDENKIQHIGTSAQEIQKLYPDLVSENENGELSVDYSRLSIIAIAAIKELKKEIEELKSKRN